MSNIGVITVGIMWVALLVFLAFTLKADGVGSLFVFIGLLVMMHSLTNIILGKTKISAKTLSEFKDIFQPASQKQDRRKEDNGQIH